MPIAGPASAPVRARPPAVAARVGVLRDEAVPGCEGAGAGDADGSAEGSTLGDGAALGSADGSVLGVGAGASPPSRVSPISSGLWSEDR